MSPSANPGLGPGTGPADEPVAAPRLPPPPPIAFAPETGTFAEPFELTLEAALPGAEIHYTLDGTIPDAGSERYIAPIMVDAPTQVRAIAIAPDAQTPVVHGLYVHLAPDAAGITSNLPLVVVHMLGRGAPDQNDYEYGAAGLLMMRSDVGDTSMLGQAEIDSRIGIKVRGRSTRRDPKHSFSLELWDLLDEIDHDLPLLDMPAHSDWALYAPYEWDRALIRNALIYALSNDVGRYAARTRFVELYLIEGQDSVRAEHYQGLYVLMERIKRGGARVAISKLAPEDVVEPAITGGYIVKIDDPGNDEEGFRAAGQGFAHVYPKELEIAHDQLGYLTGYLDGVARAAASPDGVDPDSGTHYSELIDVPSFLDHHILNTLAKNPDALRLSAFFHKDRAGALHAGPVWDFDRTMGSYDGRDEDPEDWSAGGDGTELFEHEVWGELFAHSEFRDAYVARFRQLIQGELSTAAIHAHVDAMAAEIGQAADRNAQRWPQVPPRDGSFDAEIQNLKQWLAARVAWIGENLDGL